MRVLAFDTSADVTSVAVCNGATVLSEDHVRGAERHAESLFPKLQQCLATAQLALADIELIGVGIGPGSFTGVRVGVATAKGLGFALQRPVCGVISLEALARAARAEAEWLAPCLDAFKGEVFAALYRRLGNDVRCELEPFHAAPALAYERLSAARAGQPFALLGAGYRRYREIFQSLAPGALACSEAFDVPRARHIAELAVSAFARAGAPALEALAPLYMRDSDAQLPKSPLRL
jgi:tRNA threonylcarbamoyladenosine biosynthesis protein TsaB